MSKRKTDKQLDQLGESVNALVNLFSFELAELRADLNDLGLGLQEVRDVAAPGLSAPNRYDDEGPSEEELEEILADLREREDAPAKGVTLEDVFVAELGLDGNVAWEITDSGARVYSAGGFSARETLEALLLKMLEGGDADPALINIHVGFVGTTVEGEGPYDGLLTVGI